MVIVLCCFFFFKQKTAYEMRISDWSSDVCSSDLGTAEQDMTAAVGKGSTIGEIARNDPAVGPVGLTEVQRALHPGELGVENEVDDTGDSIGTIGRRSPAGNLRGPPHTTLRLQVDVHRGGHAGPDRAEATTPQPHR